MNILGDLMTALNKIINRKILVGIPMQEEQDEEGKKRKATNAQKLFWNSMGSPLKKIPSRKVLEPAIEDKLDEIGEVLNKGVLMGIIAGQEAMDKAYNRAGLMALQACINWFDNPKNNWAPNSPHTIKQKGSDSPLIDTGEMRKSITYIIEDKK